MAGWWCNNHLEKYELVNGKDYDYPIYEMENNPFMFQTTNQMANEFQWTWKWHPITSLHATIKAVRLWHGEFTEDMAIFDGGNRWNYRKFMEFLINMMFSYGCFHGDRVTHNVICISLKNLGKTPYHRIIERVITPSLPHENGWKMGYLRSPLFWTKRSLRFLRTFQISEQHNMWCWDSAVSNYCSSCPSNLPKC